MVGSHAWRVFPAIQLFEIDLDTGESLSGEPRTIWEGTGGFVRSFILVAFYLSTFLCDADEGLVHFFSDLSDNRHQKDRIYTRGMMGFITCS